LPPGAAELIALDGDTGAVELVVRRAARVRSIQLWIGAERVVLQLDKPNQCCCCDEDGQPVARSPLASANGRRPPCPSRMMPCSWSPTGLSVKKLDLNHGQTIWEYRENDDMRSWPAHRHGGRRSVLFWHDGRTLIRLDPPPARSAGPAAGPED